jgi:hypothetical protein
MNSRFKKGLTFLVSLPLTLSLIGCATYQGKVAQARSALSEHNYDKALKELEPLAHDEGGDQLVYILDYATALQISGNLKQSNYYFLKADKLSEHLDFQSLSRQAGSLLFSEEMNQYKGDTFEKVFINAYLAMNYLQLGLFDDAMVEARRINEKYIKYRNEEKKFFELNSFSKYLSAIIWEANRSYDDAYIAYHEAYKIDPSIGRIRQDLIRSAKLARRMDSYSQWKNNFPDIKEEHSWYDNSNAELIVIFQQGWGPRKFEPFYNDLHLPDLIGVKSNTKFAELNIKGQNQISATSTLIYDVQSAAINTLKDDLAPLVAKRIAAKVAKAAAAKEIRKGNPLLGDLSSMAMALADRADLRQWSMLPQTIQMIRVYLPAGKYKFDLKGFDEFSRATGEALTDQEVELKKGEKKFVIWRSLK